MAVPTQLGISAREPWGAWDGYKNLSNEQRDIQNNRMAEEIRDFPRVRIVSDSRYSSSILCSHYWASYIRTHYPDKYILYGTNINKSQYLPTYNNSTILSEAQWAQDNGMDAFACSNEIEISIGGTTINSLTRSSNVATAVVNSGHGLDTGDKIQVSGATPSSFNFGEGGQAVTVVNSTTITFSNTGTDETATGNPQLKPVKATLPKYIKSRLAAPSQSIFTRGPIVYSLTQDYQSEWITAGFTPGVDVDVIGYNCYETNNFSTFKSRVDSVYSAWGSNVWITEFNVHETWASTNIGGFTPTKRGFDDKYASELLRMFNYIKSKGIEQAYVFSAWNANQTFFNVFTLYYHTGAPGVDPVGVEITGGWKAAKNVLLGKRQENLFLGTQLS